MKKNSVLVLCVIVLGVILSACAPTSTPQPVVVEEKVPQCSVVVYSGMGMSEVLGLLGKDYNYDDPALLINGATGSKSYSPQPGDVIVLQDPIECSGEYIAARQVSFRTNQGTNRELSGFQLPITEKRLYNATQQVCEGVRRDAGYGFDGDLYNGGCGYPTLVKTSLSNGVFYCVVYPSAAEAYDKTVAVGLTDVKWIAILSIDTSEDVSSLCD